jgi:hypothetical protein
MAGKDWPGIFYKASGTVSSWMLKSWQIQWWAKLENKSVKEIIVEKFWCKAIK